MTESLSTVPGVKAFVVYRNQLLFLQRDNGRWNLPGGAIEDGETPDQAILREMEEELCIRPASVRYLGWHDHADGARVHRHLIRLADTEAASIRPGGEEQVFRFMSIDELPPLPTTDRLKSYLLSVLGPLRAMVEREEIVDRSALRLN